MSSLDPKLDTRVVYGATCTYWGGIYSIHMAPGIGIPVCPHCFRPLFEMENEEAFMEGARKHEEGGHPGYVAFITWLKGKPCYRTFTAAMADYIAAQRMNN